MSILPDFSASGSTSQAGPDSAITPILIVDDDACIRDTLGLILERAGYQVKKFGSGQAALAHLQHQPAALLITDIYMPDFDGLELIMAVKRQPGRPPLIAMSGGIMPQLPDPLHTAKQLGADRRLQKPFDMQQLLDLVAELLPPPAAAGGL